MTARGRSQEFVRGQKVPHGVTGRAPVMIWETGDKHGCRLYKNTMKNTKHINTEINKMKTRIGKKCYL